MTTTKELRCSDRIGAELQDRANYVKGLLTGDDDDLEALNNLPLCIETKQETTITLSWGGPSDYLHITHDNGEVLRVVYRFSDWFDTAIEELDETSPLWDYAENVISCL
jgi:hypothetical protein